jgi:2-polyprenyl-3-methyl-5-hydroxy-6-metoxy-1,4-benzoquinol methylase
MFLPKPTNEKKINAVVSALNDYLSLSDYGIIWNDGERSIPEIWMLHPSRRFTYFALLSLYEFATRYTAGKNVLDFGCGVGYGSYYLASRGAKSVVGIEIDEKSYRFGCDRYRHDNMIILDKPIELLAQDSNYIGSFDVIYCSNVMEHIADYKDALQAVKSLLAPKGVYIQITPPSGKARGNPYHVTNFTVPEWKEILKDYFVDQKYFAHIPQRDRDSTENEFDFNFEECGPGEMGQKGSISGIIVCQKP